MFYVTWRQLNEISSHSTLKSVTHRADQLTCVHNSSVALTNDAIRVHSDANFTPHKPHRLVITPKRKLQTYENNLHFKTNFPWKRYTQFRIHPLRKTGIPFFYPMISFKFLGIFSLTDLLLLKLLQSLFVTTIFYFAHCLYQRLYDARSSVILQSNQYIFSLSWTISHYKKKVKSNQTVVCRVHLMCP